MKVVRKLINFFAILSIVFFCMNGFGVQTSWGGTPNVIVRKSTF